MGAMLINYSTYSYAQQETWEFYSETKGVKLYVQSDECNDFANGIYNEFILVKMQNTNQRDKRVKISYSLFYDGRKYTTSELDNIKGYTFIIKANEEIIGDCSNKAYENLKIFKRFLNYNDKPVLTGYKIYLTVEDL